MPEGVDHLFVITGGPGSGKTSLVDALERAGFSRSMEAGRGVIQDQVRIGGSALPWANRAQFAELMLCWEMRSLHIARAQCGPVFLDRGIPDVIGYLRLIGLPVPAHLTQAANVFRYNKVVFIAPPWREIFRRDDERKQSYEEAVRTYEVMRVTYGALGYKLIELPHAPVQERVKFVLAAAGGST